MAETIEELRTLSDEELMSRHNQRTKHHGISTEFYLNELHRRDQARHTKAMLGYTRAITYMTIVMTVATLVNVVVMLLLAS